MSSPSSMTNTNNDEGTTVFKEKGRIAELRKVADSNDIDGQIGIGHTRWGFKRYI
jgi:glucosamine 6-phosphate synthetase-like amidotransferase/phosphosugar isomerase protein